MWPPLMRDGLLSKLFLYDCREEELLAENEGGRLIVFLPFTKGETELQCPGHLGGTWGLGEDFEMFTMECPPSLLYLSP